MKIRKHLAFAILISFANLTSAQDIISPYANWHQYSGPYGIFPDYQNPNSIFDWTSERTPIGGGPNYYTGEYQIYLADFFWALHPSFNTSFKASYNFETVSFPFTKDCAFIAGCGYPQGFPNNERELYLPSDANYDVSGDGWNYPPVIPPMAEKLHRITPLNGFRNNYPYYGDYGPSVTTKTSALVSGPFEGIGAISLNRYALPHSVLRLTLNLHCGTNIQTDQIISSVSYIYDNTRGQMRTYPFNNHNNGGSYQSHDVIFRPELIANEFDVDWTHYYNESGNQSIIDGGGTVDYFPYSEIDAGAISSCGSSIPYLTLPATADMFSGSPEYNFAFPAPYTLISSPLRSFDSQCLAGYKVIGTAPNQSFVKRDGIPHTYKIDKNIDLTHINPSEGIIYNPSEADVTANDFVFPQGYTFKTIRGQHAPLSQVNADNTAANGGPYTDKRYVPVTTDLESENSNYPANNPLYASIYHMKNGSKLTVEGCVYIFDAAFDCETGSEIIFENINTTKNENRFIILYNGGTVTKRAHDFYFQNQSENRAILKFESDGVIEAGYNVTTSVPVGNYNVVPNANVTFTSADEVILKDGFTAQAGSEFLASIASVSVPDCVHPSNGHRLDASANNSSNSESDKLNIVLFPNPTSGNFDIQIMNGIRNSLREVYLLDMFGRQITRVEKAFRSRYEIDLTHHPKGVYFVKIIEGDRVAVKKIIYM